MRADAEQALGRWKWIAGFALATSVALLAALVVAVAILQRPARQTDKRLIGTWQSDADRTIAELRQRRPVDEKQEAALRKLFGKLRITYTETTYTTELNGVTESNRYEVLGRDKHSVVIREINPKPPILEVTEFGVIHFDGPDCFWVYTEVGGLCEFFKRVRQPENGAAPK